MLKGIIIGDVWATKKVEQLDNRKLILVAELDAKGKKTENVIVAFDDLDGRVGDIVAVTFGSGARNTIQTGNNRHLSVDAAVSMIIEGEI